jgi:hypothetical protein
MGRCAIPGCEGETEWCDDTGSCVCTQCGTVAALQSLAPENDITEFGRLPSGKRSKSFRSNPHWRLAGQEKEEKSAQQTVVFSFPLLTQN